MRGCWWGRWASPHAMECRKDLQKEITLTVSKTTHKHNLNHNIVATELKSQLLSILSHIATTSLLLSESPNYIYVYKPFSMY